MDHAVGFVGDDEAFARSLGRGGHVLVDHLRQGTHLGEGLGGNLRFDIHLLLNGSGIRLGQIEREVGQRDVRVEHQRNCQHAFGNLLDCSADTLSNRASATNNERNNVFFDSA